MADPNAKVDKKYLEELPTIDELLEKILIKYLVAGTFPEAAPQDSYLRVYNFVSHYANKDEEAGHLYNYFTEKITYVCFTNNHKIKSKKWNIEYIKNYVIKR